MSPWRRLALWLRHRELSALRALDASCLQRDARNDSEKTRLPLVAVIGPPRVGSTLMYQLLTVSFSVCYFDNLQHALLNYPYLAYRLSRMVCRRSRTLESDHGFVPGWGGPSEANYFWPRWCALPMREEPWQLDDERRRYLLRLFNRMFDETGLPMANSYNAHAFYLGPLLELFSQVLFVNMRRDPRENAISIIRARQQLRRDPRDWWSIQPAACVECEKEPLIPQVVCQLRETYATIQRQRRALPHAQIVDVEYEALCDHPAETMERIREAGRGMALEPTPRSTALPQRLERRGGKVDDALETTLQRALAVVPWRELWEA